MPADPGAFDLLSRSLTRLQSAFLPVNLSLEECLLGHFVDSPPGGMMSEGWTGESGHVAAASIKATIHKTFAGQMDRIRRAVWSSRITRGLCLAEPDGDKVAALDDEPAAEEDKKRVAEAGGPEQCVANAVHCRLHSFIVGRRLKHLVRW